MKSPVSICSFFFLALFIRLLFHIFTVGSIAGCLFIPDLGSRIPDPTTASEEGGNFFCCPTIFLAANIIKL
jgi:hypothetical protein